MVLPASQIVFALVRGWMRSSPGGAKGVSLELCRGEGPLLQKRILSARELRLPLTPVSYGCSAEPSCYEFTAIPETLLLPKPNLVSLKYLIK